MDNSHHYHSDVGDLRTIPDGCNIRHYSGRLYTSRVQHVGDNSDDGANGHQQPGPSSALPPKGEQVETFLLTRFS
jgi:hypothetical protein